MKIMLLILGIVILAAIATFLLLPGSFKNSSQNTAEPEDAFNAQRKANTPTTSVSAPAAASGAAGAVSTGSQQPEEEDCGCGSK